MFDKLKAKLKKKKGDLEEFGEKATGRKISEEEQEELKKKNEELRKKRNDPREWFK